MRVGLNSVLRRSRRQNRPQIWLWLGLLLVLAGCGGPAAATTTGLVDVGGHKLFIECTGRGSPTVVLDAGLSSGGRDWRDVQPQISEFTRVCNYDRAGLDRSETGPLPRTSQLIADDLDRLLTNARIEDPLVMVGHSFGAMNVRLYTSQHPDRVVGAVLVDGLHPDGLSRIADSIGPLVWNVVRGPILDNAEGVDLPASSDEVRSAGLFGDIPLVVVAAGRSLLSPFGALVPGATDLDEVLPELQRDLVSWSSQGKLVVARNSGHCVHCDEPQVVIDAVRQMVEATR